MDRDHRLIMKLVQQTGQYRCSRTRRLKRRRSMKRTDADVVLDALGLEPIQKFYAGEPRDGEERPSLSDYQPLLRSFGFDLVAEAHDDDYQGDSMVLYRDRSGSYGVLVFGWGSCSGCDSLQACDSWDEVEKLRRDLLRSVKWGSASDLWTWLNDKEVQDLKHYGRTALLTRFIMAVQPHLRGAS